MTEPARLDLDRPRTLGALFSESLGIYLHNFARFAAIGFAVVLPAHAIVSGLGLGMFGARYGKDLPLAAQLVPEVTQVLVVAPLIAVMCLHALLELSEERRPTVRGAIQSGLDSFAPVFVPVLAAVACEALVAFLFVVPLAIAVESVLVPTLVLPLILAVRWYFVPQAVVVGGAKRLAALRSSWELTRGSGWRVFGILALTFASLAWTGALVAAPLIALARSADSGALVVAANVLSQSLAGPALAIVSTLFYFDLRARARAAA